MLLGSELGSLMGAEEGLVLVPEDGSELGSLLGSIVGPDDGD